MRNFLILITCLFTVACDLANNSQPITAIESQIIINPVEVLGESLRSLSLVCKTEKIYPCINYPLLTDKIIKENGIFITFKSVEETTFCLTALGPATAILDLGNVRTGQNNMELNTTSHRNAGNLTITDSEIIVDFPQQNGIEISRKVTKRVPEFTYWGTIGYHTESSIDQIEEFLQKLGIEGALFEKQVAGDYHYYQIDDDGEIVVDRENSGYWFAQGFIFRFVGNEEEFKKNVLSISKGYFPDLYINIETFRGGRIFNWGN
ncbi:hypothetical protein [Aquiflexum sp.]|uniref:hypothetical protein n=1 Tax=Aquiflexum sp. TaxID=1872584 RepID=UPI003593129E